MRENGFTLLEIMVALTVLSAAFAGIYTIYSGVIGVTSRVENETVMEDSARLIMEQLSLDLNALYIPDTSDSYKIKVGEDDDEEALSFVTGASLDFELYAPGIRLNRITYLIEPRDDTQAAEEAPHLLIRRQEPHATVSGEFEPLDFELSDMVTAFSVDVETDLDDPKAALGRTAQLITIDFELTRGELVRTYSLEIATDMGGES